MSKAVPKLRFPGFEGDWREQQLSKVLRMKGKRNKGQHYGPEDVLSVSGDLGIINQIQHLGRSYAGASVEPYHIVEQGDIVYTKSPLKASPYGIVKVNRGKAGIVSTLYAVYEVKEGHHPYFWDRYFELEDRANRYLKPLVNKGAKNDMKISNTNVMIGLVVAPSEDEQKRISKFFDCMDKKLHLLRRKRDLLADYKCGTMQQIFSQHIRFKRDDGTVFPDWEVRQLREIAERRTTKNVDLSLARVLTNSAVQGVVDQGDFFDKDIANAENIGGYYVIEKGDFVYNPRISVTAPVGPIKQNKLGAGIMSPLYTIFRMNVRHVDFFAQYFDSSFWHGYMKSVANYGARHDRMAIMNNDFMGIPLPWPHPDEQRKIAEFLTVLDTKIEVVTAQITQTEAFKKGLLQQMFV